MSRHKRSSTALNKKHASRELLSFWVLKIPFTKENVEHSHTERVVKTLSIN